MGATTAAAPLPPSLRLAMSSPMPAASAASAAAMTHMPPMAEALRSVSCAVAGLPVLAGDCVTIVRHLRLTCLILDA
jgi:hypothetical protein